MSQIKKFFRKPAPGFLVPDSTLIGWSGTLAGEASDFIPRYKAGTVPVAFDRIAAELNELSPAEKMFAFPGGGVNINEDTIVVTTIVSSKWREAEGLAHGRFRTTTVLRPNGAENTSFSTSVEKLEVFFV